MLERAASLAFYGLFSLIPVALIAAAGFRLLGSPDAVADAQKAALDAGASESVSGVLRSLLDAAVKAAPSEASSVGLIGLVTLLYGSSKIFTDAGRALDRMRDSPQRSRPLLKRATDLGWTIVLVACGLALGVLLFFTGSIVDSALDQVGLDDAGDSLWTVTRWPIAIGIAIAAYDVVIWAGPTGARRRFRLVTPGALVTVALWLTASLGYTIYLSHFSNYNATYGAFAAIIILMLWVWFTCVVFLYGAELDQVLESRHASPAGGYEIRVRGRLSDSAVAELSELTASFEPSATLLRGEVRGEEQLRELLERLESLGLEPLDVRRTSAN